jgi:hypothetical protein
MQRLTSAAEYMQLLDKCDTFLFDCDGVLWTAPKLLPGIPKALDLLRKRGISCLVLRFRGTTDALVICFMPGTGKQVFCNKQCEKEWGDAEGDV